MNPILAMVIQTEQVVDRHGNVRPVHSAISARDGNLIQEILDQMDVQCSLEIGLAYGISALYICDSLSKRENFVHIVIDPNQHLATDNRYGPGWNGLGLDMLARAGYEGRIEFHDQPSYITLPKFVEAGRKLDFAFVDGWHTFDYVLTDFFYIDKLLRVGGVIMFHDTDYPGVQTACSFILSNLAYEMIGCVDHTGEVRHQAWPREQWGTSIAVRKQSEDNRAAEHHVAF